MPKTPMPRAGVINQRGVPNTEANGLRNPDALSPSTRATWRFFKWQDFPTHGEMLKPMGRKHGQKYGTHQKPYVEQKKTLSIQQQLRNQNWIAHNSAPMNFCDSWPSQCNPPCHDTWLTQRWYHVDHSPRLATENFHEMKKKRGGHI